MQRNPEIRQRFTEKSEAFQPGPRKQQSGRGFVFRHLPDTGGDISANVGDREVWPQPLEQARTADTAGGHDAPGRQCLETTRNLGDEHVLDRGPRQNGSDAITVLKDRRHILQAVYGRVNGTALQCLFEFFREDAFVHYRLIAATEIGQLQIRTQIAGGLDDFMTHAQLRPRGKEGRFGHFSLREGEFAASRA
jgi:hypothetical protein